MPTELTLDLVQSQLKPRQKLLVSAETVEEIQKLATNPDYGPEFLDCYIDHLNVLKENPRRNHDSYLQAVKFFSLVEAGNSLVDAYIKVFPDRFADRNRNKDVPSKDVMRGEASRYNNTQLVNEIRKVATVPVQLIHRHLLHEAILVQADLMRSAKSEMVRQKASDTLIRELKPGEDHVLTVNVEDGATSIIEELARATRNLASEQYKSVLAGVPLREISAARLMTPTQEIEEGEFVDV